MGWAGELVLIVFARGLMNKVRSAHPTVAVLGISLRYSRRQKVQGIRQNLRKI